MMRFLLFCIFIKNINGVPKGLIVKTPKGEIRGLAADDGQYNMFLGVPYAVVDDDDPFGPAHFHPGFNDTFQAMHDGIACPQVSNGIVTGTLQCLQLNIYTPTKCTSNAKLAVMVYFHGGSFLRNHKGRSNLSPKFLIRHEVIIISVNYRLGPYGFLCVTDTKYNNQGIKDQILALNWINENVSAFGGDVNKITLVGQSAGAMTLDALLHYKEDLAQRVILQSGLLRTSWTVTEVNNSVPINIAKNLGFETENAKDALKFLAKNDVVAVMKASENVIIDSRNHPSTKPCIETFNKDSIIPDFPMNLIPKVKGIDIMIGHANKEVMFLYPNSDANYYSNYKFEEEMSRVFNEIYDVDTVKHFYIGDEDPSEKIQDVILDFGSDFAFVHPTEETIIEYMKSEVKSVYRFVFLYEGGRNRNKVMRNLTSPGASHGDDIGYLFEMDLFGGQTPNEEDQRVIDAMTKMWTNFAKYGNPSPTKDLSFKWLPITRDKNYYLKIDKNITLATRPFHDRMAFWDLYYKLHGDKRKGFRGK